jgi:hypothetical protein
MGYDLGIDDMKLQFGFDNTPYVERFSAQSPLSPFVKKMKPRRMSAAQAAYGQGKTTTQVAKELEERYGIVDKFFELEEDSIIHLLIESVANATEAVMSEQPLSALISAQDIKKIEDKFKQNLSDRKYDGVIPKVPTLASLRGVSHLRQDPNAQRPSRPSFIDTGLYRASFKAWVEED